VARAKHSAEELRASGLPFTIVRATAFMETWLGIIDGTVEGSGHALVFGPGTNPVNFVSRDVARRRRVHHGGARQRRVRDQRRKPRARHERTANHPD
jgi:hypothetical protein